MQVKIGKRYEVNKSELRNLLVQDNSFLENIPIKINGYCYFCGQSFNGLFYTIRNNVKTENGGAVDIYFLDKNCYFALKERQIGFSE